MAAFNQPFGIAIDSNDNVFITDVNDDKVQKFDSDGTYITSWGTTGSGNGQFDGPWGIACDSSDNVYVIDVQNDRCQKFQNDGTYVAQWSLGIGTNIEGITISADDKIYIGIDNTIKRYNTSGVLQETISPAGASSTLWPAISPGGILYIADYHNDCVIPYGTGLSNFTDADLENPYGIAFKDDLIYVCSYSKDMIVVFNNQGTKVDTFGTSGTGNGQFDFPSGIAFNSENECFVVDSQNARVQAFILDLSIDDPYDQDNNSDDDDDLDPLQEIPLPVAGRYTYCSDDFQNVVLPHPYGDLQQGSGSGVWVCPLIDEPSHVYCVAAWPIMPESGSNVIFVYVDGVYTGSGWTFDENVNFLNQGNIATLTFSADPGGTVTVMCKGRDTDHDGTGTLIENPIDIIEDWMDYLIDLAGAAGWNKDETTFAMAKAQAANYGYAGAGIIQSNHSLGYWLQNILNSFWGGWRFSPDGAIQIYLKSLIDESNIQGELHEYEHISLNIKKNIESVVNRIIINYAISYTEIDRRYRNAGNPSYFQTYDESASTRSQIRFGERILELNFDWNRVYVSIDNIGQAILAAYDDAEYIVNYQGIDLAWFPHEIRDQIQGTLSLVRDTDNEIAEDVIYELREKSISLDNFSTQLILYSINFIDQTEEIGAVYIGEDAVYIGTDDVYIYEE